MDYSEHNIRALADYFASGNKRKQLLGLELEHFVADRQTLRAIPYENGVERLLSRMVSLYGGAPKLLGGRVLGITYEDSYISLEPAAQLEISIRPSFDTREIARVYDGFAKRIAPILDEMGFVLLCAGYQPKTPADELPLIPYRRYEFMDTYFSSTGTRGKNMMRGSAATQVSIDYKSEADFSKKYRVANILGPLFSFACDNAPVFEGAPAKMARTYIWNNVDPARSGVARGSLDGAFGFRDYARYVYGVPPIFLSGSYTGAAPASELFRDRAMSPEDIEHLTSMIFTDVRLKTCLEIRMADSMPIAPALAYADLLKRVFYDEPTLNALHKKTAGLRNCDVSRAKDALMKSGASAAVYGRPAREWLAEIFGGENAYEKFEQGLREAGSRAV